MIKLFAKAWEKNSKNLEKWFAENPQEKYSEYKDIWKAVLDIVVNPVMRTPFNTERITEVDDGDYQGTLLLIAPFDTYQPSHYEYVLTYVDYGSCSGCDTLLAINSYGYENLPTARQVKEYLNLALNMLQAARPIFDAEVDDLNDWVIRWWEGESEEKK